MTYEELWGSCRGATDEQTCAARLLVQRARSMYAHQMATESVIESSTYLGYVLGVVETLQRLGIINSVADAMDAMRDGAQPIVDDIMKAVTEGAKEASK